MQRIYPLFFMLLLAACAQMGGPGPIADPQKFLSSLDGPKVPTMKDALADAAADSEKNGNFLQAAQMREQIAQKHADDKANILALADDYRRAGELDHAIVIYDSLIKTDPKNIAAKEGKGLALLSKGDFETTPALFDEVLKADPTRWKTLNALGVLFTTRGMHPEAQQYFAQALKYNPDSPSIINNMGLSQALARHYDKAIDTLGKASNLADANSPQRKRIDLNTALVYAISGKLDDARGIAEKYYSGAALDNNMGLYAHLAQDDQMARDYLNMALTESKTYYARAWDNLQGLDPGMAPKPDADNAPASSDAKPSDAKQPKLQWQSGKPDKK